MTFKIGLCQTLCGPNKSQNLKTAASAIRQAVDGGAQLVVLPECFNSPYGVQYFEKYAESVPESAEYSEAPTTKMLTEIAKELKIWLVGGSFPEKKGKKIFNTCLVVNPSGQIVVKYRKMHLFDIDIPGQMTFKESDVLSPGNKIETFETPFGRVGLGICYDMRFPQLATCMREKGCDMLLYPGAFNTTTGPKHWELLQRARAVDNQLWVATCSPARVDGASYQAWGHSTIVSPWGEVVSTCDEKPTVIVQEIDMKEKESFRTKVPILKQQRLDMYNEVSARDLTTQVAGISLSVAAGALLAYAAKSLFAALSSSDEERN